MQRSLRDTRYLVDSLERRVSSLERAAIERNTVRGVWPEFVYINGYKIPCNTRAKDDGLTTIERAIKCCEVLHEHGLRPSYKALRACHYGSVTARKALEGFTKQTNARMTPSTYTPTSPLYEPLPPRPPPLTRSDGATLL